MHLSSTGFVTEQEKLQTYCIKNSIPFKFDSKIELIQEVRNLFTASNFQPHQVASTKNAGRPLNKRDQKCLPSCKPGRPKKPKLQKMKIVSPPTLKRVHSSTTKDFLPMKCKEKPTTQLTPHTMNTIPQALLSSNLESTSLEDIAKIEYHLLTSLKKDFHLHNLVNKYLLETDPTVISIDDIKRMSNIAKSKALTNIRSTIVKRMEQQQFKLNSSNTLLVNWISDSLRYNSGCNVGRNMKEKMSDPLQSTFTEQSWFADDNIKNLYITLLVLFGRNWV